MENPQKSKFTTLLIRKQKKIQKNPIEILSLPKLMVNYYREQRHQRRFIRGYGSYLKGTHSSRRINAIIYKKMIRNANYLEIGVAHGYTFEAVRTDLKTGVDPFPKSRVKGKSRGITIKPMTSDEFFSSNKQFFDIIFIDGMHTFKQSYCDLVNAIKILAPKGVILVDDVLPGDKYSALPDIQMCNSERLKMGEELETWSGDVFKSIIMLRELHPAVKVSTIISPNHPQSLVWLSSESSEEFDVAADLKKIENYTNINYEEYFSDLARVSSTFNFQLEWNSINRYLKDIDAK
jgi:hypothetical protein